MACRTTCRNTVTVVAGEWIEVDQNGNEYTVSFANTISPSGGDDTAALQSLLNYVSTIEGGGIVQLTAGTFTLGQVTIPSNIWLRGAGTGATILHAKNALNAPLLIASGAQNITLSDFKIDGNKANQTDNSEGAGIKMTNVDRGFITDLWVDSTEGHGIHLSSVASTDEGWRISDTLLTNIGTAGNTTYGSGIATSSVEYLTLSNVQCLDIAKAGFRISGSAILNGCVARRCANGGLVPVSGEGVDITVNGGHFSESGPNDDNDGIRLLGVDRITLNGVTCESNYGAGVLICNGTKNVTISGGVFRNNGLSSNAPSTTQGRDGITITAPGTAVQNVTIIGAVCIDDQGSPTQDYGLRVNDTATRVIAYGNLFTGNQFGGIYRAYTSASTFVDIRTGAQSQDPRSQTLLKDEFMVGAATSQAIGELRWALIGGAVTNLAAELNHPGISRLGTSAASGTVSALRLATGSANGLDADNLWDTLWIVRLNTNDSDTLVRMGISNNATGNAPTDGTYVEKLAADTSWFGVSRAASVETPRTAALAAVSTNWVRFRVRRLSSTAVGFTVNESEEVTLSTNITGVNVTPFIQIRNATGVDKNIDIDYFELGMTGLTR